mmetsp:Transcript_6572/g.10863  ORF Transcript_6572/g.10863 Transcript_6572/m.10863 type:complete len:207 (+) Transcript_6572:659-1279(+)
MAYVPIPFRSAWVGAVSVAQWLGRERALPPHPEAHDEGPLSQDRGLKLLLLLPLLMLKLTKRGVEKDPFQTLSLACQVLGGGLRGSSGALRQQRDVKLAMLGQISTAARALLNRAGSVEPLAGNALQGFQQGRGRYPCRSSHWPVSLLPPDTRPQARRAASAPLTPRPVRGAVPLASSNHPSQGGASRHLRLPCQERPAPTPPTRP